MNWVVSDTVHSYTQKVTVHFPHTAAGLRTKVTSSFCASPTLRHSSPLFLLCIRPKLFWFLLPGLDYRSLQGKGSLFLISVVLMLSQSWE